MAKRRTPKRHCCLCSKVLFGFDDDIELRAVAASADSELAKFAGEFMCGGCFENWSLREQYGHQRLQYAQEHPERNTRAYIYSDDNCLVQVEIGAETVSWEPIDLEPTKRHFVVLWLGTSGTDLVIPLEEWGKEMPSQREDKRLRPCEERALTAVWDELMELFPTGAELWSQLDANEVLDRHADWLNRDRAKN